MEPNGPAGQSIRTEGFEQRSGARFNLLIRPAKLIGEGGEFVCVIRDVAEGGCKVRLFHPLPLEGAMELELGNGDRYAVEPIWERDDHLGLRFVKPVPVEYLISEQGPYRKRPVRVRLTLPAAIVAAGSALKAEVRDLSQQGACLECLAHLAVDQQVRLEIAGMGPIVAKVRWRRPPQIGLVFEQTFKLDEFARIVAALQDPARQQSRLVPARCA